MAYTQQLSLFSGGSAFSSVYTSAPWFVGDLQLQSFSWDTDDTGASKLTIQGSDEDGFTSSIGTWSTLTTVLARGLYAAYTQTSVTSTPIPMAPRWIRAQRSSLESLARMIVVGKQLR